MYINASVRPGSDPGTAVNQNGMVGPSKANAAPAPRCKGGSDGDPRSKPNRAADIEAGPWARKNDYRVVIGHVVIIGRNGHNLDRSLIQHHLLVRIAPQVPKVVGLLTQALHRIHDLISLGEYRIAQLRRPAHVSSHV